MKSLKNKTIDFPLEQAGEHLARCVYEEKLAVIEQNSTVIGDTFSALNKIKDGSVDLLIVDPPYNLDKDFHGNGFKKQSNEKYAVYTKKWIDAVKPKLKDTASIYVC